jgi:putative ABC transport system permease protein
MFRNHLKIAWRNLLKDRQFTFLNLLGLSAGLACTLLIFLWVRDEYSYDRFAQPNGQIYQLMEHRKAAGNLSLTDESSGILGETLIKQMPEIEYAAAVAPPDWWQPFTLSAGEKNLKAIGQYAGKDYFSIFPFPLLEGKSGQVLADKNSIVLSKDLAVKLFGTTDDVIGKKVRFQQDTSFFVSGVFELPANSSQQFDFVLSFEYLKDVQDWVKTWENEGPHNFVLLRNGTDIDRFNQAIAGVITRNCQDTTRTAFATRFADNYLDNTFIHGAKVDSRIDNVRLFSLIAIFILAIACVNFMNLSTAKATRRLKEVGIKKVMGAGRRQLILQFLIESLLLTLFGLLLAVALAYLLLPQFNQLTGKQIALRFDAPLVVELVIIAVSTGLLAGSYPAFYLSGFNPITVLKGKLAASLAGANARKGLVVFQFTLSIVLIVSVLIVYRQVQFIQAIDPGFQKNHVIRFSAEGKILQHQEAFVTQLKNIPGVVNASFTSHSMVGRNYGTTALDWYGKDPRQNVYFEGFMCGYDFIETMGMHMAAGRSYTRNFGDDATTRASIGAASPRSSSPVTFASSVILNETAVRAMNLKDPIGKNIRIYGQTRQIAGIVKDFHFESLHEAVRPSFLILDDGNPWFKVMVRIKGGQEAATIGRIREFYESYNRGFPFSFSFLDDAYQKQYTTEVRAGILSRYFAGLAILISCLGLFGLATFTAQRRQKEIGIRKVVGASVNSIVSLFSAEFLKLILLSVCIAVPLSWWAMTQWLQSFAYRISIGPGVFLMACGSVVAITLATVAFHAIKAALVNPVKSLRTE